MFVGEVGRDETGSMRCGFVLARNVMERMSHHLALMIVSIWVITGAVGVVLRRGSIVKM